MVDRTDKNDKIDPEEELSRLNIRKIPKKHTAVALKDNKGKKDIPYITAAGRGKIAEKIIQLAHDNDIKIREDSDLAEMLAKIELDSPIPSEAFVAVAEILSYIYKANGQPNPFDAVLNNDSDGEVNNEKEAP